jgi:hypothetical protein
MLPLPPEYQDLQDRPFSFYPSILGVEHNEWRLVEATWSEMVVRNTRQSLEVAIPRSYFAELSQVEDPVIIVGLKQELEYRSGAIWPHRRKVLSMPAGAAAPRTVPSEAPAHDLKGFSRITGTGGSRTERRLEAMIIGGLGSLLAIAIIVVAVIKLTPAARPTFLAKDQAYLELNSADDYFAVKRKLGEPTQDRWKAEEGEIQYRALAYRDRGYTVILMGSSREAARYIGVLNDNWQPIHYVELPGRANTASMLRALPKF